MSCEMRAAAKRPRFARDATAWMCACTTHVQAFNGRCVIAPSGNGTHVEQLVEHQFPRDRVRLQSNRSRLRDRMASVIAVPTIKVTYVGHVVGDCVENCFCKRMASRCPCTVAQFVRCVLHPDGHDVVAFGELMLGQLWWGMRMSVQFSPKIHRIWRIVGTFR